MGSFSDHLLRTLAAVPVNSRILDLGCDRGRHVLPLAQLGFDVHACATDEGLVLDVRRELGALIPAEEAIRRIVRVDRLDTLNYPDAHFDWIVAFDVFDGIAPAQAVLSEARRVLKPGGWIYVAVSAREQEAGTLEEGFSSDDLQEAMRRADFALAEKPDGESHEGRRMVRGIYRRVEADTPL